VSWNQIDEPDHAKPGGYGPFLIPITQSGQKIRRGPWREVSMTLLALNAIKAHAVSEDGGHVAVAFATEEGDDLSVMMPANCLDALISTLKRVKSAAKNKKANGLDQLNLTMPKSWMVAADLNLHGVVVVIFDPKSDAQAGYALDIESSKKMATSLIQTANAVANHRAAKKN
jgi:hypothetical protein